METDSQTLLQSILLALIFSFFVAKLISILTSFSSSPLTVTRDTHNDVVLLDSNSTTDDASLSFLGSDENEWEGVDSMSSELEEAFSAASTFVAASASDRLSKKVGDDVALELYGLYKVATEGACTSAQPSVIKMKAKAKWNAWHRLGAMDPEEAMQRYLIIVSELYPKWTAGSTNKRKDGDGNVSTSGGESMMGPVFSSLNYEEEADTEMKLEEMHIYAREGDTENLLRHIDSGVSVNVKDSEGRTPLHWAVDRGHAEIVDLLLRKNADVNSMDNEGQTALHYAAICDRETIAESLVKQNAETGVKDSDGNTPCDLCEAKWPWIRPQIQS